MSQDETQSTPPSVDSENIAAGQPKAPDQPEGDESTIGTGTSIALGCIAGTLLLIVIGLIYLAIVALL